jgi:hypothetical protein
MSRTKKNKETKNCTPALCEIEFLGFFADVLAALFDFERECQVAAVPAHVV